MFLVRLRILAPTKLVLFLDVTEKCKWNSPRPRRLIATCEDNLGGLIGALALGRFGRGERRKRSQDEGGGRVVGFE